jgi:heme/copper-type cytochrome/quinol oxidase subunit 2
MLLTYNCLCIYALSYFSLTNQWSHDHSMVYIFIVIFFVFSSLISIFFRKHFKKIEKESPKIEFWWTLFSAFVIIIIALLNIINFYSFEKKEEIFTTVKIQRIQWFWKFEIGWKENYYSFDSCIIPIRELKEGEFRLIEVDNKLILPINQLCRFCLTSSDVIHSIRIPCISIKIDSVPGRINEFLCKFSLPGNYYGSCSEICGRGHSFIPFIIEVTTETCFKRFIILQTK